jgi:tetratricopeptide (TPR) repeat protein
VPRDREPRLDDAAPLAEFARLYALERERHAATETAILAMEQTLLQIGRDLHAWLDGSQRWLERLSGQLFGPFELEVEASSNPDAAGWAVLHAPWELLADTHGFLAANAERPFAPVRRLGQAAMPLPLDGYRLGIAFMAAAPRGERELDYEAEEAAILDAAGRHIDLFVEESGEAKELGERLQQFAPPLPVLHMSCHGQSDWRGKEGKDPPQPALLLEDRFGGKAPATAETLLTALRTYNYPLRLLFVSACETAVRAPGPAAQGVSDSLATRLVRIGGVPAVVGWEGSVADVAATTFAQAFYAELASRTPPGLAAAAARRALLNRGTAAAGGFVEGKEAPAGTLLATTLQGATIATRRDWHLARVWLGPQGGAALVAGGALKRRTLVTPGAAHKRILAEKNELEVASPAMFVGRGRQLQTALRVLAPESDTRGLLLHGLGRVGKTSLAARVADRMGLAFAVVYGRYDAPAVVEALRTALATHSRAREMLTARAGTARGDPAQLEALLLDLIAGPEAPCAQAAGGNPVLLLIDDLEQVREPGPEGERHRVRLDAEPALRAVLRVFALAEGTASRLLLTSRYPFTLVEGQKDWATTLASLELGEFGDRAAHKLALRQLRASALLPGAVAEERVQLLEKAERLARGHPGLQDLLGAQVALRSDLPPKEAGEVLDAVGVWLTSGEDAELPPDAAVQQFAQALNIGEPLKLVGSEGRDLLRALTLFRLPVPERVLADLSVGRIERVARLRDLGLLMSTEGPLDQEPRSLAPSAVASARLTRLAPAEEQRFSQAALASLFPAWGGGAGRSRRPYPADIELTRLALLAGDAAVAEVCAADAVTGLTRGGQPDEAGTMGQGAVRLLEAARRPPSLELLAVTGAALRIAGDGAAAAEMFDKGAVRAADHEEAVDLGELGNFQQGRRQLEAGDIDSAQATFERLCDVAGKRGDSLQFVAARGSIADILVGRGELDEALRIRTEEQLPVYTRLGDVRAVAITQGSIADILVGRGELDEALRIRTEEQLPVYTRLGDVHSVAVTQGQIADMLAGRGELDEALRIRTEEELPVYTRLGDVRAVAITQGRIAGILAGRGELDEALRIRTEEELPVYTRLGDVRAVASTQGQIANILAGRGELDEALRIRTEEELPVYTRLGDVRAVASTQGQSADILAGRGELDEALRIRTEEQLPVYTRLGDVRAVAITQGQIADILAGRGELDEALRIRTEEELPVYTRLGDVRAVAITQGQIADMLAGRGELDEALRIRTEEELPVYTRLGDVRAVAITQGRIAGILAGRGELDEALRIRTEEELPVYTRLGDVHSVAVTQGRIAGILAGRGELDEALRIRTEEELPVYTRLGDVRAVAITQGSIADILVVRGELDEALRIRTEEELPVYTRLGDVRAVAITQGSIANILAGRGELDEALRIRTEEELPVYTRLDDVHSVAVTQGRIAGILAGCGELDEALRIRTEEELPVYTRLGDVRAVAITQGSIADILVVRGELDEALRVRTEEELPVYTHLGDVRAAAATQGQIADIHFQRGDYDNAMAILVLDVLPFHIHRGNLNEIEATHRLMVRVEHARRAREMEAPARADSDLGRRESDSAFDLCFTDLITPSPFLAARLDANPGWLVIPKARRRLRAAPLMFWPGASLLAIEDTARTGPREQFAVVWDGREVVRLDWTNEPIYAATGRHPIATGEASLFAYVRFFFTSCGGSAGALRSLSALKRCRGYPRHQITRRRA